MNIEKGCVTHMSVVKGKRTESDVDYFEQAYKVNELITKFLLSDFGIKKTYRELKVFTHKAGMTDKDADTFNDLVDRYNLETEASYPLWLIEYYRDIILTNLSDMIFHITAGHTMYPNSVYEFNVKRQHISDAIINCYNIKHNLQLMIRFFPANMKKYIPYVKEIDTEVEMLKRWRKNYTTKMKNYCYNKDEMTKRTAARAIDKSEAKATVKLQTNITFLEQIIGISYTQAQLYENYRNTQFYYDQNNRYCSTNYIAAITYYDKNGFFIGDSAHDFRE